MPRRDIASDYFHHDNEVTLFVLAGSAMGLGVLNDRSLKHVPGTAALEDLDRLSSNTTPGTTGELPRRVKHGRDGVILVPQPSDSPDDPLNWPLWQRDLITGILCLLSVIASTLSPLLAANTFTLALYFETTFTKIALLTGYHLLGVAIAGFIFVPSARVWGKRHLYILGTLIIIISSAWGGGSGHNYRSLVAARFFQGVGLAPFEALVNASVGDLYFVHERGRRMALSNLSLFGGAFFTPVIVGKMTYTLGWQWTFYFIAIFSAVMLPLVIFFVPETAFVREDIELGDNELDQVGQQTTHDINENNPPSKEANDISTETHPPIKMVSKERMRLFNGRKTNESFFKLLLRPFPLFFHPGILWACIIQGTLIGWTVLIGIVLAVILFQPPMGFSEVGVGYSYAGAFIGAILGFILAGLISDSSTRWMAKRNGGIFEPEFRMVLVIPQLIFGCAGLYGFGIVSSDPYKYRWFWPVFFFALEVLGMVLGAVASALYIVDAHRDIAIEGFTCLLVFKNIFSFGLTTSGFHWFEFHGIKGIFLIVASVQVVVCLTTVFMYVFGKKNRAFLARHDMLAILRLR